jgi:predicted nucleotide-binding protein
VSALDGCMQATNRAIGKLESNIKMGVRDKQGKLIEKPQILSLIPPKGFISHGKESSTLNKLEEYLSALGVEPLIVKDQPNLDKTVDIKVNFYLGQADFVMILATGDDKIDGILHPRQNVIHEIGLAQKTHAGKIIYLLENGTEFPSNINPKVWENFDQKNLENVFLRIVIELKALGIIRAVKTQEPFDK